MERRFILQKDLEAQPEIDIIRSVVQQYDISQKNILQPLSHKVFKEYLNSSKDFTNVIPIGTIPFINSWLEKYYNKTMFAMEIPRCLWHSRFLHRTYGIVTKSGLPKFNRYFVKNLNHLKSGTFVGDMVKWWSSYSYDYEDTDFFVLSSELDILSEWRVYVIRKELVNMCHYDGDPLTFPNTTIIQQAINICNEDKYVPNSYTLDVAVTTSGTCLLEIHPFTSIGLYTTLWDERLLDAYEDGINFYVNNNSWWSTTQNNGGIEL